MSNVTNLPDVSFCETDTAVVEANIFTVYEAVAGVSLADGDPVRLFLEGLAAVIAAQRVIINNTGKGNLLYYADGGVLDHLGIRYQLTRLEASSAAATMKFSLGGVGSRDVVIPSGTRVSPDGELMFATDNECTIAIGSTSVYVSATCETAGDTGNGYAAGEINLLVDQLGYGLTVENTAPSTGGEDAESDERFKERIYAAPESLSIAGPTTAYEELVKAVRQDIADVAVYVETPLETIGSTALETIVTALGETPAETDEGNRQIIAEFLSPSNVHVCPLLYDGELPDAALLEDIEEALSADDVRPLTDCVYVESPSAVTYDIDLTYYIPSGDELAVPSIQSAVDEAVKTFQAWQCAELGRALNPSKLIELVREAGAGHVVITSPEYTALAQNEVAQISSTTVTYGGLLDGI